MRQQAFQAKDSEVVAAYLAARRAAGPAQPDRLRLSWSNWGFGPERLDVSAARLARNGIRYIELHGNRYGADLGYKTAEVRTILADAGLTVSGICGMATADAEFASNRPHIRQRAIDYNRRQADFCAEVGGSYLLVVPGAVGRPAAYDRGEFGRAVEAIRIVAEYFKELGIRGAIEPIRPEEVSLCHSFDDARRLIAAIAHPGVQHINGDLYHMLASEDHIGQTILEAGPLLINLHMADTNRRALGGGLLDVDVVLMSLYAIGYEHRPAYCTPEPLGAGGNPYSAMFEAPDPDALDVLVERTASTFYEREAAILEASESELYGHAAVAL
jgi:D-psicose/D-tagatose/L-ribulose 3-epimerase